MKNITVTRRTKCRLCDGLSLKQVLSLAPTPPADKYVTIEEKENPTEVFPLDLYLCFDCGHVQILDVLDPNFLFDGYTYVSAGTKVLVDHFAEVARLTCELYRLQPGALVIDVGSNDGSLLLCFQRQYMKVLGIDPATEIAARASAAGIPTLAEFLSPAVAAWIRREHGAATVVCAFNAFAHADNLAEMLDSIRDMLAPEGIFVFEVSYLLDVIERMLLGTIFHEHLSYHSMRPMAEFLRRHGMELIDVRRNTIQGGSVVGTAQQIGGPHPVLPSVAELLKLEHDRGLARPETFEKFVHRLADLKRELSRLMDDLQKQGKSVWGYGASRSGTTLIAEMNLENVIRCIVDDGPDKQNKLSPGSLIPIRPFRALLSEKPDYVIILAWAHAERIIQKSREYLEGGGRFIICIPEIRVVGAEALTPA